MEIATNAAVSNELVTGISRSGRVRKKSSKLLDFQSPDEVPDTKIKRSSVARTIRTGMRGRPPMSVALQQQRFSRQLLAATTSNLDDVAVDDAELAQTDDEDDEQQATASDDEEYDDIASAHSQSALAQTTTTNAVAEQQQLDTDEDEIDNLVADLVESVEAEQANNSIASSSSNTKVRSSLYMTEKANKRKMLLDGRIVTGKLNRKDKGKARFTAYSLWAREFRKTSKFSKNQDLDFANAARRLSELWANVSNKEKNAWRRKAKILASKTRAREMHSTANASNLHANNSNKNNTNNNNNNSANPNNNNNSFYNRPTTSRTMKLAEEKQERSKRESIGLEAKRKRQNSNNNSANNSNNNAMLKTNLKRLTPRHNNNNNNNNHHTQQQSAKNTSILHANQNSLKTLLPESSNEPLPGIEIIDVAAHLKLLGESLNIIGERLKEHEGQIAVSGSLSVLLDSLLCSIAPLLCLTTQIKGLENVPQLKRSLAKTLDNIAYVMPGL